MQSTGHSSTQVRSFTSMHGSQIVYVMGASPYFDGARRANPTRFPGGRNRLSASRPSLEFLPGTYASRAETGARARIVPRSEDMGSRLGTGYTTGRAAPASR